MAGEGSPVIAVCVPSPDMVHMDFAVSLAAMLSFTAVHRITTLLINEKTSLIQRGRQNLVNRALRHKATHLLFLDSDMTFPRETALRLLRHNLDIIATAYSTRKEEGQTTTAMQQWGRRLAIRPGDGLVEADYVGFSGIMVRAEVFRRMEKPYFPVTYLETSSRAGDIWVGEDYGFCDKARELGYRILVDAELSYRIGHLGQKDYRLDQIDMSALE